MLLRIDRNNSFEIQNLVCDFNGTIALDGKLFVTIREKFLRIHALGISVWVITADTHGNAAQQLESYDCQLKIIGEDAQDVEKQKFIHSLGVHKVCAIGNGRNDRLMLRDAALGICVVQDEGCAADTLMAADVVVKTFDDALDLLLNSQRLKATLRT